MIRVLFYLALVAALAIGVVWFADRPGQVSILWQGYRIETSVAIALVGVLALAFAAMVLWMLLRFIFGLPGAFGYAARNRRKAKGFSAISKGMVAVAAGDPAMAYRHAADARRLVGDEPLTLLLEAQTAQLKSDRSGAEATFKDMMERPETRILGLRGLFVEARRRGDADAAQTYADEAVKLSPSLAWANDALLEFHSSSGNWVAARTAVERRAALKLADKGEAKRQRAVLLTAEAQTKLEAKHDEALSAALEAVKLAPTLAPAAAMAGQLLAARGDIRKASRLIEAAWRENPHPDMATPYINARPGDSAVDKLARAEMLAKQNPANPESALTVAAAAIPAREFAKARAALMPLVAGGATMRVCMLMADLEEAEHGAAGKVREWLGRATRAPRDPVWVADGVISALWRPVSPVTGQLDAFVWTPPPVALDAPALVIPADEPELSVMPVIEASPIEAPVAKSDIVRPDIQSEPKTKTETQTAMAPVVEAALATPVIFPVPHAPDDPGLDTPANVPAERRRRFRLFG
jgi:HemY protein